MYTNNHSTIHICKRNRLAPKHLLPPFQIAGRREQMALVLISSTHHLTTGDTIQ
uniref:Uncharacterized protein n=1 Tax=Setaria italica TaxID=4555 RepID=K3ZZ03_SETIT